MFSHKEFEALKKFVQSGRSVLILMNEGGEQKLGTNINYLLEQFGISVNQDSVIRTSFYKYLHPKEAYISHGVISQDFARIVKGEKESKESGKGGFADKYRDKESSKENDKFEGLNFVYPYGSSLNTQKPAVPLLSTGPVSYPTDRPIIAAYQEPRNGGRLLVSGSIRLFDDEFLDKENNSKIFDGMMKYLSHPFEQVQLKANKGKDEQQISDYHRTPDTAALSDNLRSCLQESAELPKDFTKLFSRDMFKFDTNLVPDAVKLFKDLDVKHEHITLIPPTFETPMPALQSAVFPPSLKELDAPALDLFDLDEEFANEK